MSANASAPGESVKAEAGSALFRRHWGWLLAFGIVQILAGSIAISVPPLASLVAVAVFGALMLTAAVFQIAHAVRVRKWPGFALHLLGGLLYAAAGVLVLIYPFPGMLALTLFLAGLLLAEGILRIALARQVRQQQGWGWFLAGGIASVVLGALLMVGWPGTALWALGLMLGVNLVFNGATSAMVALACRKKQKETPRGDSPSGHATATA